MKLTEEKKSELEYCAKDMIKMGEKILGMLAGEKVKKEASKEEDYEDEDEDEKPSKGKILAMFMKKK